MRNFHRVIARCVVWLLPIGAAPAWAGSTPQTITFANPGAQNFGTTPTLTATSDSGLTVTFSSSTTGVCTITSGGTLTFITTGTCIINADQPGDATYAPAAEVTQSFTVNAVVPGAPTNVTASPGDTQVTVYFSPPASNGGATITNYTATSNPGGLTGTGGSSPVIVSGLTDGVAYTFTVTADNIAGTGPASAASNSVTPNPGPAVVSVAVPADGIYGLGQNLDFTVSWDSNVTVTGTPQLAVTFNIGGTVHAGYVSSPTATTTVFRYTIQAGNNDPDGITVGALTLNGGTIQNSGGTDATLTLNSVGSTTNVLVDTTAPTLPAANIVVDNQLDPQLVVLTFSESLDSTTLGAPSDWTVTAHSGTPTFAIAGVALVSANAVRLTLASVDVTNPATMIFNAQAVGHLKVTPPSLLTDIAGNHYAAGLVTESGASHILDTTPPTLSAISATATGISSATLSATASEKTMGYWIAVASGSAQPTAPQVKAATSYSGVAILGSGFGPMPSGSAASFPMNGLPSGTAYDVYLAGLDAAGNLADPMFTQLTTTARANPLCYVAKLATGANDGSSWTDAYTDLQSALHDASCLQVWVAKGVYKPTATADPAVSFSVLPGVKVYGGFAGSEAQLADRNVTAHVTVLSGDVDNNDANQGTTQIDATPADIAGSNSYHVVVIDGTTAAGPVGASTVLDGFTITGGDANGAAAPLYFGGGLYCLGSGSGHACSPTLSQLVFSGNQAYSLSAGSNRGGAIYNDGSGGGVSSPTIVDAAFTGNRSANFAGAIYNAASDGGVSSPTLNRVTLFGNYAATAGGAMVNDAGMWSAGQSASVSSPTLSNVTFVANGAQLYGGAVFAQAAYGGTSNLSATNVTFSGNSAVFLDGGAVYYNCNGLGTGTTCALALNDVILWGDTAPNNGAEVFASATTATLANSVVQGGCPAGVTCTKLIIADPLLTAFQNNGGFTQTMRPNAGSPAIDAGAACAADDQRGLTRPLGAACDIGAVEVKEFQLTANVTANGGSVATTSPVANTTQVSACTNAGGVNCSAWYSAEAVSPVVVTLAAATDSAHHFAGWGGACAADGSVTMNANKTCTAAFAANTLNGVINGLVGDQVVLHLVDGAISEDVTALSGATGFSFTSALPAGSTYTVSVGTQPSGPSQTCSVVNASAAMPAGDVTDIVVDCTTNTYAIGGSVTGLNASGLSLQLNGGSALSVSSGASAFTFPSALQSGSSYVVNIATQPSGYLCNVSNASGTVTNAIVTSVAVDCTTQAKSQLTLTIDDGHAYARYGQILDYIITLSNSGNTASANVAVASTSSAGLDLANASWQCLGGGAGAVCASNGTGALSDSVTLPATRTLTWLVSVPVIGSTPDPAVTLNITAAGASPVGDTDTLAVFRDGFNVAYGNGAASLTPAGATNAVFALPAVGNAVTEVYKSQSGNVRVQSVAIGGTTLVRLLAQEGAQERASAWTRAQPAALLALGSVQGESGGRIVLLEGAEHPLLLPLATRP